MATDPGDRPFDPRVEYASLEEADAVIRLALYASLPEEPVYVRVKLKAQKWGLSPTQTAQRILLAEHAQLAPEW